VVISSSSTKKEEATKLGATDFVLNSPEHLANYAKSLDVLLICGSGPSTDWGKLLDLLDDHGKLVLLDLPEQPISLPPTALVYRHLSVVGSFVGSNVDLAEMLSLASKTGVRPWIEKVGNTCEDVNNGIKKLMSGKARYRVVICGQGRQ
jgi:D-arabinose 1-dehydrogenase-like Zn-dependent alcohol dehydrogenase